jgi:myo-inositol-1(or 4)-monophosphatase
MTFLQVAIKAAKAGSKVTTKHFGKENRVAYKEKNEVVSEVDHLSEEAIIKVIKKHYPDHSIWSEERPEEKTDSPYRWVIDPIDGTEIFLRSIPWYGIVVALEKNGKPIAGVHYFPELKRLYTAQKGKGTFLNGKRIHVSSITRKQKPLYLLSSDLIRHPGKFPIRGDVAKRKASAKSFGVASLDLSLVAQGKAEASYLYHIKPGDIAAGILLVKEAGGKVTNTKGKPATSKDTRIIASNNKFHRSLLP